MSKMPRKYAESTLSRMYKKLALPSETVELLFDYFTAMSHLYERLPLKDAYKIISEQNKGLINREQFVDFSEIARHEDHEFFILSDDELYTDGEKNAPMDRILVHESLLVVGFEEYYEMEEAQCGKPLCVLPRNELLRYKDDHYVRETPQTIAMTEFLRKSLGMSRTDADEVLSECDAVIRYDCQMEMVFELIDNKGFQMDEAKADKFISLYQQLHNNTRMSANRGFTPAELSAKYSSVSIPKNISFAPDISNALQNGVMGVNELGMQIMESNTPSELKLLMLEELKRQTTKKPVSRNAPCPCGSGKKYKRCCGK